ncbi:MAG: adenylate/guanylate cyclase domain-containing protein [Candidatus Rokubacteria bacterium]|nr:adenylate/guanylate cyclase domain-containing protein [Candidatus Rokubacteria bacterium]
MTTKPETHYARSGDVNIAYQVVGEGPRDLVLVPGWVSNVEVFWEEPSMARFLQRLASFSRLILFDKRGTGLSDRVLATVMFTDIVDATRKTVELGDRRWRDLLDSHHALVREQLARFRGREIDTAGDGFLAAFDGPARAVRAAAAVADAVRALGLEIRAGLHTGECEVMWVKLGGIAVHVGARIAALAKAGEVLVSSTVKDLVAGSGLRFEYRGTYALKGVLGEWHLFAAGKDTSP